LIISLAHSIIGISTSRRRNDETDEIDTAEHNDDKSIRHLTIVVWLKIFLYWCFCYLVLLSAYARTWCFFSYAV